MLHNASFFYSDMRRRRTARDSTSRPALWEEYKRKEKDRSSITGNSIAQRRKIQSKRKSNLCKKNDGFRPAGAGARYAKERLWDRRRHDIINLYCNQGTDKAVSYTHLTLPTNSLV